MSVQKQKGSSFERLIADYFAEMLGEKIDRLPLRGANDVGDIGGLFINEKPFVIECKNTKADKLGEQMNELQKEKANADADIGVLIKKRKGKGQAAEQYAIMTVNDLIKLVQYVRELENGS